MIQYIKKGWKGKRGLACADEETRKRVASSGGHAKHKARGLQTADEETRKRVAATGGQASGETRRITGIGGGTPSPLKKAWKQKRKEIDKEQDG